MVIKRIWLTLMASTALLLSGCTTTGSAIEEAIYLGSVATSVTVEKVETSEESVLETARSTEFQPAEETQASVSYKEANAVMEIGSGDLEYWAYTN